MAAEPTRYTIAFVDHEEPFIAETIRDVENLSTLEDRKRVGACFRLVLVVVQPNPTSATRLRFSKDQIFGIVNSLIIRMGFFG